MPRKALRALVDQRLAERQGTGARYVDLRVDLVLSDFDVGAGGRVLRCDDAETLYSAGGVWDRKRRKFTKKAKKTRKLRLHVGQATAARWFTTWLREHKAGRTVRELDRDIWSVMLTGGRRSGKSDFAVKACVLYAVEMPRSIVWIVVPTQPDQPEIERALDEALPRSWYDKLGAPWYTWTLTNGSEIHIKSAHDPRALKRGRADFVVVNEAQKQRERVFSILRPATADRGGLLMMTSNPPDSALGEWVAEYVERSEAGKGYGKVFYLDPKRNPFVITASLEALGDEIDDREYRREILGEFLSPADVVFHQFSNTINVREMPTTGDITRAFLRKHFNSEADYLLGADFQRTPYQAGVVLKFFEDPAAPNGEPLIWLIRDVMVEQGDEDNLIDGFECLEFDGPGISPETAIVVGDASGEWQDSDRTKGRGSFDWFRKRGYRRIFKPDARMEKNPLVDQRIAVANALYRSATGKHRLFMDPVCKRLRVAARRWEMKNGAPFKGSVYAHLGDAKTYPLWRLYPRRGPSARTEYIPIKRERAGRLADAFTEGNDDDLD